MLGDEPYWSKLSANGRAHIEAEFSPQASRAKLLAAIDAARPRPGDVRRVLGRMTRFLR